MDQHMDLLPRRLVFGNPERTIVRISHDGTRIAFLAPVDGILNLWVAPIERIEDARPDRVDARQPARPLLSR
jgi:Lipoprotein LpqB beta-propeller domain